jgi:NTE family protein
VTQLKTLLPACFAAVIALGGCATRSMNLPITQADPAAGDRFENRLDGTEKRDNLVILAFSGGGTRAAALTYGVLEFLRLTRVVRPMGNPVRLLDAVDLITGVSGGSFTALAHGLYGDTLFADCEQRFLKRDVQGEIISRVLRPAHWGALGATGTGRDEVAAGLYDEILFNGATLGDLPRAKEPVIMASAMDISSGFRFFFNQRVFDVAAARPGTRRHGERRVVLDLSARL